MNEIGNAPNLIGSGIEKYASGKTSSIDFKSSEMGSRIAAAGKEFEGVFLSMMLKEMRSTLDGGGFFGEETSDTYGGMFDMFVGQDLAESSPLGIADMMMRSYSMSQSGANGSIDEVAKSMNASAKYDTVKNVAASDAASISFTI